MRILSILAFCTLGLFSQVLAQVDISNARANPKTFIFDDDKHTVHGYIYKTLEEKSSCCGNDAIYLEIKFDQTGTVTSAKTLTGKNECYKKSIVDIVQNVKWDATGVTSTKTIYFEVKPIVACSGSPGENVYKAIPREGGVASVSTDVVTPKTDVVVEPKKVEPVVTKVEPVVTKVEPVVAKVEPVVKKVEPKVEEDFLSDAEPVQPTKVEPVKPTKVEPIKPAVVAKVEPVKPTKVEPVASVAKTKPGGPVKLPPQEDIKYVSKGDMKPDASHNTTWVNDDINAKNNGNPDAVKYADQGTFAVNLRTALRKSGYCGLAHATVELETDPSTGRVLNTRILAINDPKVAELVPSVIKELKFNTLAPGYNRYIYTEFKTEIVCEGQKPKYNLDQVEDFLVRPTASNQ